MHEFVGITAFVVGAAQLLFLVKLVGSMRHGKAASGNPWGVTTLE